MQDGVSCVFCCFRIRAHLGYLFSHFFFVCFQRERVTHETQKIKIKTYLQQPKKGAQNYINDNSRNKQNQKQIPKKAF